MLNVCSFLGYISTEIKYVGTDTKQYCNFSLAVPRDYKNEDGSNVADFIPCYATGGTAELLYTNFVKGKRICVTGRLESSSYEKDGRKRYTLTLKVIDWYYGDTKPKILPLDDECYKDFR